MDQIYHKFRQLLNGTMLIDIHNKYMMLCIGIAVVHFVFAYEFGTSQIMLLFWYNVAITIFYIYHSFVSIRKKRYVLVYVSSIIEILFHAALATLMLGWDWGFAMYTMSMIPAAFYLTYTLPQLKGKLRLPIWTSVLVSASFIIVRAVSDQIEPLYQGTYPEDMRMRVYYFNIAIALVILVCFSSLFALEISHMQRKLEQENHRLGQIANYDPLTHLLNRRSMNQQLRLIHEEVEHSGKTFCIMLIDIDDFKKVNDTYGHDCGDEVLISIAKLISNDVREEDAVCRWGGEEILVLLKEDLEIAKRVAERICKDVRETVVQYKDNEVKVTLTIGIADYKKEQTIRSMIEEADRNMYYGKHHGKNQVVTSHERIDD